MLDTYIYRTFPPEIVSNTFDFEVRCVVHHGRRMRGVFARRPIQASECSVFVGIYPGLRIRKVENLHKADRYAIRHSVDRYIAMQKVDAYSLSLRAVDPEYVLDPTDAEGNLIPEFIPYIAGYINEPPPKHLVKSSYVYNQPLQRYEAWLLLPVEQGEEIFIYYGNSYLRDYPIDPASCSVRLSRCIPRESIFQFDHRGIPEPLKVPEIADL